VIVMIAGLFWSHLTQYFYDLRCESIVAAMQPDASFGRIPAVCGGAVQ